MKFAVCNELFGSMDIEAAAEICKKAGYDGIEFTPFTVFGSFSPAEVQAGIVKIKKALKDNDLSFTGFHWLLANAPGGTTLSATGEGHPLGAAGAAGEGGKAMSISSPDKLQREAAIQRLKILLNAAGELGGGFLVLGSPKQRGSSAGQSSSDAAERFKRSLCSLADYAVNCNSSILIEALDHSQCDVINTMAQAQELVSAISSPGITGMFDFHNCGDETESWDVLIRKYKALIKYVHINEWDGGPPGSGSSDYAPAFKALREIGYRGWISMEIFIQPEDPFRIIADALAYMKRLAAFD